MKIHSDKITRDDILAAARNAGVRVLDLTQRGSQSRQRAFNLGLTGHSPFRTQWGERDEYAATWDEWGMFLAALFDIDPAMHTGKNGYLSREHFHWVTGDRFRTLTPSQQHKRHKWEPMGLQPGGYAESWCDCGAVNRWYWSGSRARWDVDADRLVSV